MTGGLLWATDGVLAFALFLGSAVPELRWMVRAVTRDPDAIAHLAAEGKVEVVQGDMADREGLEQRLQGAKYVFIVTPGSEDRVELTRNAVEATKAAGADFVVLISGTTVGLPSTRSGGQWQQIEAHLRGSELPYCVLRCEWQALPGLGVAR
jgi:uncharacterized protein YbjT (DUF2867 family)